jgi:hypothetical protein
VQAQALAFEHSQALELPEQQPEAEPFTQAQVFAAQRHPVELQPQLVPQQPASTQL